MSLASDNFLTVTNILNILKQNAIFGVLAVGMTFVIVTGGIDLSIGAVLALSACLSTSLAKMGTIYPLPVALFVGILCGTLCGVFSGFFVAYAKVPAFIATLATTTIARGAVYVFTNGRPINGLSEAYKNIGRGSVGVVPILVIIYAVVLVFGTILLGYTKFGRHAFAVGGNRKAALVSGVNVKVTEFMVYVIMGACCGLAGIMYSARIQTGHPAGGEGYETDVITAAVIGGASLSGGKGSVPASFIGILIIGVLGNGLDLLNVSSYYQQIIKGVIILLAVLADNKKD